MVFEPSYTKLLTWHPAPLQGTAVLCVCFHRTGTWAYKIWNRLVKIETIVSVTIVSSVCLWPDPFLKACINFPTSWAVSEVNRDELKDLMLAAWKANNSVPGTVTRQLANINFSKSATLAALSKKLLLSVKEHILGNLHSKTHLGTFQTINLHLFAF